MATIYIYRVTAAEGNPGYVNWIECEGYQAPPQLINDRLRSINIEAQAGTVTGPTGCIIENIGTSNSDCSGVGATLNATTTTTTTTLAPINFTITPTCNPSNTSGIITISSFSGGNGTYQSVGIGDSQGTSYSATVTNLSGATSYQWTGLVNGTYFVTLRDSLGNHIVKSTIVNCGVCGFNGGSSAYYAASSGNNMFVTVTLNSGYGISLGPKFFLNPNVGTSTPPQGTLTELLAGKVIEVSDSATTIQIASNGICENAITVYQ